MKIKNSNCDMFGIVFAQKVFFFSFVYSPRFIEELPNFINKFDYGYFNIPSPIILYFLYYGRGSLLRFEFDKKTLT